MKIKELIQGTVKFITDDIWKVNIKELTRAKAWLVRMVQSVVLAIDSFSERSIGFQSVALSYFTTMATIPFLAVCFALTNGFGMENWLKDVLTSIFPGEGRIPLMVMDAADNILKLSQSGWFGAISALSFIWLIVWMMMRVEKVFNNVWGVKKPQRKFFKSFGVELSLVIILPMALALFFIGTNLYSTVFGYLLPDNFIWASKFRTFLGWVIFCVLIILLLSAMYKWIPAIKVDYRYAIRAAVLAGIAFTVLQFMYIETQVMVTRLNTVYGVIAVIPLFMIWLRFSWLIILYGAQFTYSFQTLSTKEDGMVTTLDEVKEIK